MGKVTKNSLLSILKKYHLKAKQSFNDVNDNISEIKNELSTKSNPNLLINGDFQVWQRGENFTLTSNTKYGADRWCIITTPANSTSSLVKTTNGMKFKYTRTNSGASYSRIGQFIENPQRFSGKPISVSFKLKNLITDNIDTTNPNNFLITLGVRYSDTPDLFLDSVGVPEALSIKIAGNNQVGDGIYKGVGIIPEQTISKLLLFFNVQSFQNTETTGSIEFELEWVKLELGSVATPFVPRPYAEELMLCERYQDDNVVVPYSNPNLLINGDFQVWQRGTNITCDTQNGYRKYTSDRWRVFDGNKDNGHTQAVNSATFEKHSDSNNGFANCMKITTDSDGLIFMRNPVEGNFYNKPLTLSFYVKGPKYAEIYTSIRDVGQKITTLTGEWQYVKTTIEKFNRNESTFWVEPIRSVSMAGEYLLANVKLEVGSVATPFVPRSYGEELILCQRYYQKVFPTEVGVGRITSTTVHAYTAFPVEMRANPTATGDIYVTDSSTNSNVVITGSNLQTNTKQVAVSATGTFDVNKRYFIMQTNLTMDAEIY